MHKSKTEYLSIVNEREREHWLRWGSYEGCNHPHPLPYEERERELVDPARDSLPRPRPVTPLTTYREEVFQCGEFRRLQPPPSTLWNTSKTERGREREREHWWIRKCCGWGSYEGCNHPVRERENIGGSRSVTVGLVTKVATAFLPFEIASEKCRCMD